MHVEILQLMLKESIQIVENIETNTKYQKDEIKLRIKDAQISKLKEQVMFRDELIEEAKRLIKTSGINQNLQVANRIVPLEDIIYENQVVVRGDDRANSGLSH